MSKKKKVKSIMKVCPTKEEWMDFYNDEENFMLNSNLFFAKSKHFLVVDLHPAWCGGVEILAQ